ncbi:kanamycin nucleotidyltransferase [Paenibacillus sp. UNCCL117]|uniref:ANT(4')-I family aminoglycoside nucleotidyltransferase n=1 Tax=unclassified Paenibacillus TaxID=185978 RepID=UPI00088C170A|nr:MULTISPECIES: ANT(4')-I family aminoglycoside nucleotidyltransferase [unclassified Paenibacillus]SDD82735.1 kanamycin nucleotidyltransferase [Paenibacillus sp. cl123]SFW55053.1 kanamycin nucleotidyltransferase [Paenibacillus sp. UNCCL117]
MNMNGPVPRTRSERLDTSRLIADNLHARYGHELLALGLYGSMARGTDGPYSDIEIFCVLRESALSDEACYEWSSGPWKAEVNVCFAHSLLQEAASVDGSWPLTHGPYFTPLSLYDPEGFFPQLRQATESPERRHFKQAIEEVLVGEMYEFAGKLRNASRNGAHSFLPYLAMEFAHYGAMLVGLHNRTYYSTGSRVFLESLELPGRPAGFDPLLELVMSGALSKPETIVEACEAFWSGLGTWAAEHDYVISTGRMPF